MSAVGLFLQDPLTFMANNVIIPGWDGRPADALDPNTTFEMTFVTKPSTVAVAQQLGRDLGLYFVVPKAMVGAMAGTTADSRSFNAYYCAYQQNNVFGAVVSSAADYMFTATMDGCTFAVGQPGGDGSRLVYHSNKGGNATLQQADISSKLGTNVAGTLAPADYRMEHGMGLLSSTTFGVRSRTSNSWSFYSQIYFDDRGRTNYDAPKTPRKYFLREIKKFA